MLSSLKTKRDLNDETIPSRRSRSDEGRFEREKKRCFHMNLIQALNKNKMLIIITSYTNTFHLIAGVYTTWILM